MDPAIHQQQIECMQLIEQLPEEVRAALRQCDLILDAADLMQLTLMSTTSALEQIRQWS